MTTAASPRRPFQFTLRTLLVFATLVGVYFSIGSTVGYIEASGLVIAAALLGLPGFWGRRRWLLLNLAANTFGLAVLWFAAVDWSIFVADCEYCHLGRDTGQYRVLRVPVYEIRRERDAWISRMVEDLGAPCPHRFQGYHKYRYWGIVYAARPCIHGSLGLFVSDEWYDDRLSEVIRDKARATPTLPEEFRQRVLFEQDFNYLGKFVREVRNTAGAGFLPGDQSRTPVSRRVRWAPLLGLPCLLIVFAALPAAWGWRRWRASPVESPRRDVEPATWRQMLLVIRLYWWTGIVGIAGCLIVGIVACFDASLRAEGGPIEWIGAGSLYCGHLALFTSSLYVARRLATKPAGMVPFARLVAIMMGTAYFPFFTLPAVVCVRTLRTHFAAYCELLETPRKRILGQHE